MNNDDVKKNLRNLRKNSHLTQQEMAMKLGIKRTTYRNIESGPTRIINEVILKVADLLDKPVENIICGYDISKYNSAVLCERNEENEKKIVTLEQKLLRLEQDYRYQRELTGLYRDILIEEKKRKKHE